MRRILLTLFLLPLASIVLVPIYYFISAQQLNWIVGVQALWFGAYAALSAIPLALILGAPLLLLAAWRSWWHAWQFMLGGAVVAAALPLASALRVLHDEKLHLSYRLESFGAVVPWLVGGLVYGLVFWFVAIRGNPLASLPGHV